MIAVFTRCVIEICTRKQYEPHYKYYRIIIYWSDFTDTHEAGRYLGSVYGLNCRIITITDILMCEHVFVVNIMHRNIILEMEAKLF